MIDRPLRATNHCRHYDYEPGVGPQCACAVDLTGFGDAKKCMPPVVMRRQAGYTGPIEPCPWREEYTDAERLAWEEFQHAAAARALVVVATVLELHPKDDTGSIACPACTVGTFRWTRSRVNGHIWGRCSTPDCCQVIQ